MDFKLLKVFVIYLDQECPKIFNPLHQTKLSDKFIEYSTAIMQNAQESSIKNKLYPSGNTAAYNKFKARYLQRLIDEFLIANQSAFKAYNANTLSNYWLLTIQLKQSGHLELCKYFAKKGLSLAKRNKKYRQAFKFADFLKRYYMLLKWDAIEYVHMEKDAQRFLKLFEEEQHWTNVYFSLTHHLYNFRLGKISDVFDVDFQQYKAPDSSSKYAHFYYHSSWVLKAIVECNYQAALAYITEKEIHFSKSSAKVDQRLLDNLKLLKGQIYFHLNQLDDALLLIQSFPNNGNDLEYGRVLYLQVRILLRKGDLQQAFEVFRSFFPVIKEIKNLELPFMEGFYLLYGLFFALNQKALIQDEQDFFRNFRHKHWLNSLPIYSSDKLGLNIAIHLIDFFMAHAKGWAALFEKSEQLDKYRYRYLKKHPAYQPIHDLFLILKQTGKYKMGDADLEAIHILKESLPAMEWSNLPFYMSEICLFEYRTWISIIISKPHAIEQD